MRVPFPTARRRLQDLVSHPILPLSIAIFLVVSSLDDVVEPMASGADVDLGTEHGVLVYGLSLAVKSLLSLLQGVEKLRDSVPAFVEKVSRHESDQAEDI